MKLLTTAIKKALPPLYTNEDKKAEDVPIVVKFFDPMGSWNWYATEGSPTDAEGEVLKSWDDPNVRDALFFGLVRGDENELGYFTLGELQAIGRNRMLGIERDMHFGSHTLAEALEKQI